jgi:hypothetical protein
MNTPGRSVSLVIGKTGQVANRWWLGVSAVLALTACFAVSAHAAVALLLEEPYGRFGGINPTGHAAVYLSHVCADAPTQLRMCRPGEYGSVISRYHKIHGYDWIAVPLVPYLYATESPDEIPSEIGKAEVAELRNTYRQNHLADIAPDVPGRKMPRGEWIQLVGSAYDRTIHGFQIATTAEQDERFIALFNDRKDVSHFNLLFHNCADFSREVLNAYIPSVVHRNFIADVGLTTPKQVARSLVRYAEANPDVEMSTFVIPQVEGSVKRSHPVNGITESLLKSKKYLIPLALLSPSVTGTVAVAYLLDGRFTMPKDAPVLNLRDAMLKPEEFLPASEAENASEPFTPSAVLSGTASGGQGGSSGTRSSALQR